MNLATHSIGICSLDILKHIEYWKHTALCQTTLLLMHKLSPLCLNCHLIVRVCYHNAGDVTISGNVQVMVDSDLNGESPQFTLTCFSIGGPATTVTWTRDSEEVQGGVTVLDNAETAQYTHTLTVTGRLPGQYACTVSNNKPSTNARSRLVQGDLIIYVT